MNPKSCPECKSKNTRQMDREHYGDTAYCLSCYNKFTSYEKVVTPREPLRKKNYSETESNYLSKAVNDIKLIKARLTKIEAKIGEVNGEGV